MSSYSTETSRSADARIAERAGAGSSVALIVPTLLKNMIGAGIFSLPVGLRHASPIPGLIVLGTIGVLSASSYWMIGYCCISCSVKSFRDLWNMVLGPKSAWIIDVTIFLNGWITLICYIILIGDFTTKSFEGLLGADHILARNRALNETVITVFVLLPLSLAKDLQRLAYTSILGLGVLVYVLFLVIHDSILNSPAEISQDVPLCEWSFGIFEAIALYCHAFVAHYNAPKVFSELANPTLWRWTLLVGIAYSVAFVVYAEFAWTGFRRFEWSVEGNVLKNYGPQLNILIAWLGMGFSIAFTYPLVFNSAREAAINLTLMARQQMSALPLLHRVMNAPRFQQLRHGSLGSSWQRRSAQLTGLLGPSPDSPNHKLSQKPGTKTTFLLVFLTYAVAVRCEDVGVVNALAGSVMGCMVCLVLPGLLFFNTARMQQRSRVQTGRGLQEALLPKGLAKVTVSQTTLLVAQFAGMLIFLSGLVFTIVGTVVILLHHWK
ncbi:unnamed protein product [Cladocopium goreaui]|uniref:Sodium-coupled neutral amino acid transporter 11 (Solute carrier family 38 member 11) n=1 Tax=Cladocopium goreaui TaxID=2562237 RepID=A0A9P1M1X7_9DINO|nr:unnamed protein product [Cladocopium goreaui]